MDTKVIIELVGYLGSALVLVSMLMTSVVKLRIINMIGSIIFTTYAFIIKSYPTAFMNLCLVLINIYFLYKMLKMGKDYEVVESDNNDDILKHLLNTYKDDINKCFPGISYDLNNIDTSYTVLCENKPVGFTLAVKNDTTLNLILDYTIPQYRDLSIGNYLMNYFKSKGYKKVVYNGPTENHKAYLDKMNFKETNEGFVKEL